MASAALLATTLDEEMLLGRNVEISSSATPNSKLESKTGEKVSWEIGGRWLVHYLLNPQVFNEPWRNCVYVRVTVGLYREAHGKHHSGQWLLDLCSFWQKTWQLGNDFFSARRSWGKV